MRRSASRRRAGLIPIRARGFPFAANRASARAFTLVELLAVVAIVGLLAALSLPRLAAARDRSLQIRCASNMRNLHVALLAYAADHDGTLPPNQTTTPWDAWWFGPYLPGYASAGAFCCPADRTGYSPGGYRESFLSPEGKTMANGKVSYGGMGGAVTGSYNHQLWGRKLAVIPNLAVSVLLAESQMQDKQLRVGLYNWGPRWLNEASFPHAGGKAANVLFADGHVTAMTSNQFQAAEDTRQVIDTFP